MNGKTIEESKAIYEASAMKKLMDADGHTVCERCYCCDASLESHPCYLCGGFSDDDEDWPDTCSACGGEGEIFWIECLGCCDEKGHHKPEHQ